MDKINCTILDDYQNVALKFGDWSRLHENVNVRVLTEHLDSEQVLVETLKYSHILVVMRERTPLTASLLAQLPQLKLIVTSGMRNASIDLNFASARGIAVCGTASSSNPPIELTWALILNLARQVTFEANQLKSNQVWQSTVGLDLYGRQLGLIGLGKIGKQVAKIGKAFGMSVIAWSQNLTAEAASESGVRLASSKEELLRTSDIVSIHLVLSERTRHLIKADDLKIMKKEALLINTSRAAIIEERALRQALDEEWIRGAAVDVFEEEPLPIDHPMRNFKNLLATPHLGYVSESNYKVYFQEAIEDIESFLRGSPLRQLNKV